MKDYLLRFANEEECNQAISELLGDVYIDIIGDVYKENGDEAPFKVDGYHVNIRTDQNIDHLKQYFVEAKTPFRAWF